MPPRIFQKSRGVDFEFDQMPDGFQGIAKQEPRAFFRAEQIADQREIAALDLLIENRRALGLVHPPLNFGGFQVRIDLLGNPPQMPVPLQVENTLPEGFIPHRSPLKETKSPWLVLG
jgi:hypothetical protein